jgi:hypothetical protein
MPTIHGSDLFKKKGSGDSDDEDKKGDNLYVGGIDAKGGGGSGLMVEDNPNGNGGAAAANDVFSRVLANASSTQVDGNEKSAAGGGGDDNDEEKNVITMYANGFVLNDGPLRDPDTNAEDKAFCDDLMKGYVPRELVRNRDPTKKQSVRLALADRRHETYTPPVAPSYVAFSGGAALGSTHATTSEGIFSPGTLPMGPELNPNEPSTTIQIKTNDGKKLRLKVNLTITVEELAALVAESAGQGENDFTLIAGFPPVPLTDAKSTVEAAGLKGASVTQKAAVVK